MSKQKNERIAELEAQVADLTSQIAVLQSTISFLEEARINLQVEVETLNARNLEFIEVLTHYANPDNWDAVTTVDPTVSEGYDWSDTEEKPWTLAASILGNIS